VGSLLALAQQAGAEKVIACIDAHMGEVYHAAYARARAGWEEVSAPGVYAPEAVPLPQGRDWGRGGGGVSRPRRGLAPTRGGQRCGGPRGRFAERARGAGACDAALRRRRGEGRGDGRSGVPARKGRAVGGRARVSAVLRTTAAFEPMRESDPRAVIEIEEDL